MTAAMLSAFLALAGSTPAAGDVYVFKVGSLGADQAGPVREALQGLPQVASVEVDAAAGVVRVNPQGQALLPEATTAAALEKLGLEVQAVEAPAWARWKVYVAESKGGG